jgi:laminin alpha 1/2
MEGLSDIKQVLLRAKFHTDQIEGMLHHAFLEKADTSSETGPFATSIEVCSCPKGYIGDSCEGCDYGYRKSSVDSWLNECVKCDCNGHSPSCDLAGKCLVGFAKE